jgi:hypothetical protein
MKTLSIAIKDMLRAFRSFFALAFMFGVPILMTILFAFLFGGAAGDEDAEFSLPVTDVIIVNQDEGNPYVRGLEYGAGPWIPWGRCSSVFCRRRTSLIS